MTQKAFLLLKTHGNAGYKVMKAILLSSNLGKGNNLAPKIKHQLKVRTVNRTEDKKA